MTNTERVQKVTPITPADRRLAAHRALTAAAGKVRITQGQRQAVAKGVSKSKAAARSASRKTR